MVGVCFEVFGWSDPGGDLRRMWGRDCHALRLHCESEFEWMGSAREHDCKVRDGGSRW